MMISHLSKFRAVGFALAGIAFTSPAIAQNTAMVMKEFNAWSLHQSRDAGHNICYAISEPVSKKPKNANRAAIVFYVSAWPKDGVVNQVSVKLGYPIDTKKNVTVQVDSDTFELVARDERAYVYDATQELKLLEAMKKGTQMVVKATSTRGTETIDTYSLKGVSSALKSLAKNCS